MASGARAAHCRLMPPLAAYGTDAGGAGGSARLAQDGISAHCRGKRGRNFTWRFTTACTRRHQHTIGRGVRPTLTTAKGIESATTVRRSGWLSEHKSSGVFTPKLESGPVHGWLCHTASVAGAHGWGSTASTVDRTRSGITNSPT